MLKKAARWCLYKPRTMDSIWGFLLLRWSLEDTLHQIDLWAAVGLCLLQIQDKLCNEIVEECLEWLHRKWTEDNLDFLQCLICIIRKICHHHSECQALWCFNIILLYQDQWDKFFRRQTFLKWCQTISCQVPLDLFIKCPIGSQWMECTLCHQMECLFIHQEKCQVQEWCIQASILPHQLLNRKKHKDKLLKLIRNCQILLKRQRKKIRKSQKVKRMLKV